MKNKSVFFRAGRPVRLCSGCRDAVGELCAGRYALRQTAEHSRKALCALCGHMTYTLEYTAEKGDKA